MSESDEAAQLAMAITQALSEDPGYVVAIDGYFDSVCIDGTYDLELVSSRLLAAGYRKVADVAPAPRG